MLVLFTSKEASATDFNSFRHVVGMPLNEFKLQAWSTKMLLIVHWQPFNPIFALIIVHSYFGVYVLIIHR